MQTAYVVRGHITAEGMIIVDEPTALSPGPIMLAILPIADDQALDEAETAQAADLWNRIDAITALPGASPPDDGLTARDSEAVLYGPVHGTNDVW